MALTTLHPLSEVVINANSTSIGATPIVAYARAPFRGKIVKVGLNQTAAVTGTGTLTVAINGTAVTGGVATYTAGSAGTHFSAIPTALNFVNEDDVISFTPAGATGATIAGNCYAVIRRT
jgi:hypothetical protein